MTARRALSLWGRKKLCQPGWGEDSLCAEHPHSVGICKMTSGEQSNLVDTREERRAGSVRQWESARVMMEQPTEGDHIVAVPFLRSSLKNIETQRELGDEYWHSLTGERPSLEVCDSHRDAVLGDVAGWVGVGRGDLSGLFQP